MGFLNGLIDIAAALLNSMAKEIDKKSDDELDDMSFNQIKRTGSFENYKTPEEMRDLANRAHDFYEKRKEKDSDNWLFKMDKVSV